MLSWLVLKIIPTFAGYLQLTDFRMLIYLSAGLLLLLTIFIKYNFVRAVTPDKFFLALFAIFLLIVISHIGSLYETTFEEKGTIFRNLFLIITLTIILKYNNSHRLLLLKVFVLSLAVAQVLTFFESQKLIFNVTQTYNISDAEQRIAGIYLGPHHVSYAAVIFVGIGLIYLKYFKNLFSKFIIIPSIIISVANAFLSISRAGLVGLGLIIVFWAADAAKNISFKTAASGLLILLVLVMLIVLSEDVLSQYFNLWKLRMELLSQSEEESRWLTITAGFQMFLDYPFLGVGWDNVAQSSMQYGATMESTAHNAIVQCAAEGGLFGIAFALGLLFIMPFKILLFPEYRNLPGKSIFLGTSLAVIFFNTITSSIHLESQWDFLIFWILITSLIKTKSHSYVKYNYLQGIIPVAPSPTIN